jgi:hypothetical protein
VVTDPKADDYEVIVSLKAFPPGTNEEQMRAGLETVALAHMFNAPARLAMSHPGLRGKRPESRPPDLDRVPVAAKLEKLFKEYRPPGPKK